MAYSSLTSKINRIINNMPLNNKKRFPSLKEYVGKTIALETDNDLEITFGCKTRGILREYDDTWLVIEAPDKKNKKELYYYRLNNITSINVIDEKNN